MRDQIRSFTTRGRKSTQKENAELVELRHGATGFSACWRLRCWRSALAELLGRKQEHLPRSPTFYKDVLPILQDHCQSCHRPGEVAPMPLVTYEQTRPWAGAMAHAVEMKMMPPWFADPRYGHFANDVSLTPQQIATIVGVGRSGSACGRCARRARAAKMG